MYINSDKGVGLMIQKGDLVRRIDQPDRLTYRVKYIIDNRATVRSVKLPITTIVPLSKLIKVN